jgi:hypothetical protein
VLLTEIQLKVDPLAFEMIPRMHHPQGIFIGESELQRQLAVRDDKVGELCIAITHDSEHHSIHHRARYEQLVSLTDEYWWDQIIGSLSAPFCDQPPHELLSLLVDSS